MTIIKAQAEIGEFRKRFRWISAFVLLCFLVLVGRLFQLQVVDHELYRDRARDNIIRRLEEPAVRGTIRDTRGRVLATNRPSHNVYVTPHFFDMDDLPALADYLELEEGQSDALRNRLQGFGTDDLRRFQPFVAGEDLSRDSLALVETHLNELGGVHLQSIPVRAYPYGELTAHLVGYVNQISGADMELWQGRDYRSGDIVGRVGIERTYEAQLRGRRGWTQVVVNARGVRQPEQVQQAVLGEERRHEPQPGYDLTLTVDVALQRVIGRALRGHPSAAVVAIDVRTGEILGMVSKPSYDPNALTAGVAPEQMALLLDNPLLPLFNRAVMGSYSPGSTFKVFTALAALEAGLVIAPEQLFCGGYHELGRRAFRCSQTHGEVDLPLAIVQSCNVYFYRLAERPGMMNAINLYARHFGFGTPTGLGMNEASGHVDSRAEHREYRLGHALNAAIGQGRTLVTVLQLAVAYAALGNGGLLYRPRLVRRVESADGTVVKVFGSELRRQLEIDPTHLAVLAEALVGVVHHRLGTAHEHELEELEVAGKTGTAEVPRSRPTAGQAPRRLGRWFFNRDHGWFAGFAPAHDPRIAIAVLIEHGGTGGRSAAPVALRILRDYFHEIDPLEMPAASAGENPPSGPPAAAAPAAAQEE